RDRALAAAMATGDADLFRRTMATYRERLAAVPLSLDDTRFSLPMSPQEAVARIQDATVAAMPKVQKKLAEEYEILAKKGELPVGPTGLPVERGVWIQGEMLEFQQSINNKVQALLNVASVKGAPLEKVQKKAERV